MSYDSNPGGGSGRSRPTPLRPKSVARLKFGEIVIRRGWVSPKTIEERLQEQAHLRRLGAPPRLGQILISHHDLTPEQFLEAFRESIHDEMQGISERSASAKRIGKYLEKKEIGRNEEARVFEAIDPQDDRRIAIKVLHGSVDRDQAEHLRREAASLRRLGHPNIASVDEVGFLEHTSKGPRLYVAMEYLDGGSLATLMTGGRTPRARLLEILEIAARAVGKAHSAGITHGNLRPSNILLEKGGRIAVADFVCPRPVSPSKSLPRGYHYQSPEQLQMKLEWATPRCDVYALGTMLYQILTGHVPFLGDPLPRPNEPCRRGDPRPPHLIDPEVDVRLEAICLKSLAKRPRRRYGSASEFADDLSHYRHGRPVVARPEGLLHCGVRWVRRRWAVISAAILALASVALALAITMSSRSRLEAGLGHSPRPPVASILSPLDSGIQDPGSGASDSGIVSRFVPT